MKKIRVLLIAVSFIPKNRALIVRDKIKMMTGRRPPAKSSFPELLIMPYPIKMLSRLNFRVPISIVH